MPPPTVLVGFRQIDMGHPGLNDTVWPEAESVDLADAAMIILAISTSSTTNARGRTRNLGTLSFKPSMF